MHNPALPLNIWTLQYCSFCGGIIFRLHLLNHNSRMMFTVIMCFHPQSSPMIYSSSLTYLPTASTAQRFITQPLQNNLFQTLPRSSREGCHMPHCSGSVKCLVFWDLLRLCVRGSYYTFFLPHEDHLYHLYIIVTYKNFFKRKTLYVLWPQRVNHHDTHVWGRVSRLASGCVSSTIPLIHHDTPEHKHFIPWCTREGEQRLTLMHI